MTPKNKDALSDSKNADVQLMNGGGGSVCISKRKWEILEKFQ